LTIESQQPLTAIYLIRHARSDIAIRDEERRPLTADGRIAAQELAEQLTDLPLTAVYSSPYLRTVQTVEGLAAKRGLTLRLDERLRERNCGGWVDDFTAFARRQWSDFTYKLEGRESLQEAQQRNQAALADILREHSGEAVAIGTHGTALSTLIHHYNPGFGWDGFCQIVDRMPYVLRMDFRGAVFCGMSDFPIGGEMVESRGKRTELGES
jgi:2,3-bisphosphoglycerate-dependent phosphoglycerate mutase